MHIATHGYYYETNSHPFLNSGLVLSNANISNTGYLSGFDVLNMDLTKCKLFVLSSCQSARGIINEHTLTWEF